MEAELWGLLVNQGPWAALFIWHHLNTQKKYDTLLTESADRESKLISIIDTFSAKYDDIKEQLRELRDIVVKKND